MVDCGDGSEGVGGRAVDELSNATVVFTPASLQRDRVLLEVVEHVGDGGEEEMLNTAASSIHHDTKVLQREKGGRVNVNDQL